MAMITAQDITAVILAGGKAKRFNGQDKGLLRWQGKPLIQHALALLRPQVGTVLISANRNQERYQALTKCPVISDSQPDFQGPLQGLADAMAEVETDYSLLWPCDVPDIATDVVAQLAAAVGQAEVAVLHDGSQPQYVFALLPTRVLPTLLTYLEDGGRSIKGWLQALDVATVSVGKLKNLNTPLAYAKACVPVCYQGVPVLGFVGFSGAGKTTLATKVVAQLVAQGVRVAVVKHTHHAVDVDTPGKDSYRFRESGATQVLLGSSKRYALLAEGLESKGKLEKLDDFLPALDLRGLDLIVFEGFKHATWPKVEVNRTATDNPYQYPEDTDIMAVASDDAAIRTVPWLDIAKPEVVTAFVLAYMQAAI